MTSKNDITGDLIASKAPSDAYRNHYDAIFRKVKVEPLVTVMEHGEIVESKDWTENDMDTFKAIEEFHKNEETNKQTDGINVLSLFDGMSCGMIALDRLGIKVDNYFASEIDKWAIKVSEDNYPNIVRVGDVSKVNYHDGILKTEFGEYQTKIDLVIGGSPCQGFSLSGKGLAFDDPRSVLYFEFERILKEVQSENSSVKFLLENVRMKKEFKNIITSRIGVDPIAIDSNLLSAQNRYRLYWTNIDVDVVENLDIKLVDVLQKNVGDKFFVKSGKLKWLKNYGVVTDKRGYIEFTPTIDIDTHAAYIIRWPRGFTGGLMALDGKSPTMTTSSWPANNLLFYGGMVRQLTPIECERLQTVPDNYTKCVSDTQRYAMLGNGWTVDVIAHIFKGLKNV